MFENIWTTSHRELKFVPHQALDPTIGKKLCSDSVTCLIPVLHSHDFPSLFEVVVKGLDRHVAMLQEAGVWTWTLSHIATKFQVFTSPESDPYTTPETSHEPRVSNPHQWSLRSYLEICQFDVLANFSDTAGIPTVSVLFGTAWNTKIRVSLINCRYTSHDIYLLVSCCVRCL